MSAIISRVTMKLVSRQRERWKKCINYSKNEDWRLARLASVCIIKFIFIAFLKPRNMLTCESWRKWLFGSCCSPLGDSSESIFCRLLFLLFSCWDYYRFLSIFFLFLWLGCVRGLWLFFFFRLVRNNKKKINSYKMLL